MIYLMMFWKMKSIRQQDISGTIVSKILLSTLAEIGGHSCSFWINFAECEYRFNSCMASTFHAPAKEYIG